jgi:hypothetical protein
MNISTNETCLQTRRNKHFFFSFFHDKTKQERLTNSLVSSHVDKTSLDAAEEKKKELKVNVDQYATKSCLLS